MPLANPIPGLEREVGSRALPFDAGARGSRAHAHFWTGCGWGNIAIIGSLRKGTS